MNTLYAHDAKQQRPIARDASLYTGYVAGGYNANDEDYYYVEAYPAYGNLVNIRLSRKELAAFRDNINDLLGNHGSEPIVTLLLPDGVGYEIDHQ